MTRIALIFLLFMASLSSVAQDCQNPMSNPVFQTAFNQVASQPTNQKKLERSLELASRNCLMTAQIKNIAVLFTEDNYRLEFCKTAYNNTFDRVNFFDVYDAFTTFSFAIRLYDYTKSPGNATSTTFAPITTTPVVIEQKEIEPRFAAIIYPSSAKYTGVKGCDGPIAAETVFTDFARQVALQPTDEAKYVAIHSSTEAACYSMAQVMKVTSLISAEKLRLRTLSETFPRIYDQNNYLAARALFSTVDLQNQWKTAAEFALAPAAPTVCSVAEADMKSILKSLQSKNFVNEKIDLLSAVKKDYCFNVAQIKTIAKEFPFDKDRLEAMKILYERCPDQSNYYKLLDDLSFAYLRDELTQFIKNNGK